MKYLFTLKTFVILLITSQSCYSSQRIANPSFTENYSILDSLSYVDLPDNDLGTEGNYYYKKIVSYGDEIIPNLIEKVTDTLTTNHRIADFYNLKNSDIAVQILENIYGNKLGLWDILFDEFSDQLGNKMKYNYYKLVNEMVYYELFFSNSAELNYNNRLRLYKRIKDWYVFDSK